MTINQTENIKILWLKNISQITWSDLVSILPEMYLILMSLVGLIVIGMSNFKPASNLIEKKKEISPILYNWSINVLWYTLMLYILKLVLEKGQMQTIISFSAYTIQDSYTLTMKVVVILTVIIIMIATRNANKNHPRHLMEYPILLIFMVMFLLILISSYNFITVFLSILGFSLTLYVLLLNDSFNQASREAGIKYFYLSTVSTGLLICGIFFAYLIFNTTSFMGIIWLVHNWKCMESLSSNEFLITVMLYFIIFGFLFKLAAFPCHLWAPEVYDGSPNTITVLFVLPIKIATFAIFIRILGHTFGDLYQHWHYLIWMSAIFSMIWGCLGALTEQNIKKFMAYSSINQMGFLLMGVTSGTYEGFRASLLYLLLYIIMNLGFFIIFLTTKEKTLNRPLTYVTDFNDFAQKNYLESMGLVVILFSMAGIPPLGGFFGKYFIFLHSFETGHIGLVIVGMLTSLIGAYYYLRIIKIMWFEKPIQNRFYFETNMSWGIKNVYIVLVFVLITFILWLPMIISCMSKLTTVAIHPLSKWR